MIVDQIDTVTGEFPPYKFRIIGFFSNKSDILIPWMVILQCFNNISPNSLKLTSIDCVESFFQ